MKSHLATLYNVATTLSFPRSVYFNLGPLGWYNCDIIDDVTTLTHETSVDLIYIILICILIHFYCTIYPFNLKSA
jgi:hypothetical protein